MFTLASVRVKKIRGNPNSVHLMEYIPNFITLDFVVITNI